MATPTRPVRGPFDDTRFEESIGPRDLTLWRSRLGQWLVGSIARLAPSLSARLGLTAAHAAWWLVTVLGVAGVALATWATAGVYDAVVERDGVAGLDEPVLRALMGWRTPAVDTGVTRFTDLGGPVWMPVLTVAAALLLAFLWRSRTPVVLLVVGVVASLPMTVVGKRVVDRVRPPHELAVPPFESSPSFPSGHTLNATVVVGILVYLLLRRQRTRAARVLTVVLGAAWVLAMGLSRVFLGHHWLTDVMAGWALGAALVLLVVTAHRVFLTLRPAPAGRG